MTIKPLLRITTCLLWVSLTLLTGCASDNEPQPVDCTVSTLSINTTSSSPTSCAATDGSISATATGGLAPYQFALDAGSFSANADFTGLASGVYLVKVRDTNNCERTKTVTINPMGSDLAAAISTDVSGCTTNTGMISIDATGGTGPYTYQLDAGTATDNPLFEDLVAGTYTVKVTDDIGCSIAQSVKVTSGTSYKDDIIGIINTNCAVSGCHVAGGAAPIAFTSFANIQSRASLIKSKTQSGEMPKDNPKLPQAQLDLIACWVDDGALNN